MRGTKAKKIRKSVYGNISPKIPRDKGSMGEKLRKNYQEAKKFS